MSDNFFNILYKSGKARVGLMRTAHGEVPTPQFMPVGTQGTVKSLWPQDLVELDAKIILANAYHLYLRPGHRLIEEVGGGLHGLMSWERPLLTDSGGFQVFSLNSLNKTTQEGVEFRSHLNGDLHLITPEKSMEIQRSLGSDIVMCFDHCPSLPASEDELRESVELTVNWAKRCKDTTLKEYQKLFAIVQGGLLEDLRLECLERLEELSFEGLALGGLSVGEKNDQMSCFLENFVCKMPIQKPRYLMGVGTPLDIINAIGQGLDIFDCVLPTRNARNGQFLTNLGPLNIKNERFKKDSLPPDPKCLCRVCQKYTRAYIRHLCIAGEYLAGQMASFHNLHFYLDTMRKVRSAIKENSFDKYKKAFYNDYTSGAWQ